MKGRKGGREGGREREGEVKETLIYSTCTCIHVHLHVHVHTCIKCIHDFHIQ